MTLLPIYALTVYEEDDATPLFTVSTNPAHAQPYLKAPESFPEQEVDFTKGAASIGQVNVQVVDVPVTPGNQSTGYLTARLADVTGYSQLNGHRALLTQDLGSGAETVLDGVVNSVVLLDTFVTYELGLRDIRERERKTKAFERTTTPTILPRGVLDGYGQKLLRATTPIPASYREISATEGEIEFQFSEPQYVAEAILTAAMREALIHIAPLDDDPDIYFYDRWRLLWRETGTADPYEEITRVQVIAHPLFWEGSNRVGAVEGRTVEGFRINNFIDGGTLPATDLDIDVIIQYDGPVTKEWPLHLENMTVGELLVALYDGDYSTEDPKIRYNSTAVLALATPIRGRIVEPVDDLRAWAEKHAYPVAHAAPTLNADGEIAPVTYLLPPDGATLTALSDANCAPEGAGWSHGTSDAVNVVKVDYLREYRLRSAESIGLAESDKILERKVSVERRIQASIDLLGEQALEISSLLLRAIGTVDGAALGGDGVNEVGRQVAERVRFMVTDRFALGGQYFRVRALRTDATVEALAPGSWCTASFSWMPDYLLAVRGLSRLAQVVSRRNVSAAWCVLSLVDAGSANAPVAAPTLGTITAATDGVVSIPVNALGSGAEARIEYAVNVTEPAAGSSLWTHLRRVSATGTITTPPFPAGVTVWFRARGEQIGRRPSAWTTADDVTIPSTPRVEEVRVLIDELGVPTIQWTPNGFCNAVRIYYEVHERDVLPTFGDDVDADADDLEMELTDLAVWEEFFVSIRVEPYPTWTGSAASGTPGPAVDVREIGIPRRLGPFHVNNSTRSMSSATETILETVTIPMRLMGTRGSVRVLATFRKVGTTDLGSCNLYYNGTGLGGFSFGAADEDEVTIEVVIENTGATNSQQLTRKRYRPVGAPTFPGAEQASIFTRTEDTTVGRDLTFTGQLGAAPVDDIELLRTRVEYLGEQVA